MPSSSSWRLRCRPPSPKNFSPAPTASARVLACEVLIATAAMRNHIRERKEHILYSEMQTGRKLQMQTMDSALLELYQKGEITYDLALSHAANPTSYAIARARRRSSRKRAQRRGETTNRRRKGACPVILPPLPASSLSLAPGPGVSRETSKCETSCNRTESNESSPRGRLPAGRRATPAPPSASNRLRGPAPSKPMARPAASPSERASRCARPRCRPRRAGRRRPAHTARRAPGKGVSGSLSGIASANNSGP